MTTIEVPDALYRLAAKCAAETHTTPERRVLKALRDTVKREWRRRGLGYTLCPACYGLAVEDDTSDDRYHCLECGAYVDPEGPDHA